MGVISNTSESWETDTLNIFLTSHLVNYKFRLQVNVVWHQTLFFISALLSLPPSSLGLRFIYIQIHMHIYVEEEEMDVWWIAFSMLILHSFLSALKTSDIDTIIHYQYTANVYTNTIA